MVPQPNKIAIIGAGPSGLSLAAILEKLGGFDYVVYEGYPRDVPPRGGCLDLHPGNGQRALREAGVFDEFQKYARFGDATIHRILDHRGNLLHNFGEGRDAPDIDRWALREVLLTGIPEERVCWGKKVDRAERDGDGQVVLKFADGTTAEGFKLVVGADGVWSKIRPLVTDAQPSYSGNLLLSSTILPTNPFYPALQSLCGMGSSIAMGNHAMIFTARQGGDGHYRIDVGIHAPADLAARPDLVDLTSPDAVKRFLLQPTYFGGYAAELQDIIRHCEGGFYPWVLYYMPPERLSWETAPGVTLIGDAAHVTTPFVGDGVNCAMRDACILAGKLKEMGVGDEAVREYEKEMFPFAVDVVTRSLKSQETFFEGDAPRRFLEVMKSDKPLIGAMDHA